jgi:nucleotide-binding universal stress UspA family protein
MGIKTILVPIDGSKESFTALDRVFVVAERFGAHIKALHVMQSASEVAAAGFFNLPANLRKNAQTSVDKAAMERAMELQEQFEARCLDRNIPLNQLPTGQSGPTAEWHQEVGDIDTTLIRHGRASDVIVVSKPRVREESLRRSPLGQAIEAILIRTGRPVLIAPPESIAKKYTRVAFGWNDSIECTRALAMTMPWLVQMDEVTILVAKKKESSVKVLIEYLAWHDVKANIALLDGKGNSDGEAILSVCSEIGAEGLIIGGFSRSRASQLLFGGVTQYLLVNTNIVTVMVH